MKNIIHSITLSLFTCICFTACGDTNTCTPKTEQCSGTQIQTCLDDGTWEEPKDCASGMECMAMEHIEHCMKMESMENSTNSM